ncbi:MAG TPA: succinate dehydrogenase, cytochrome b556 subunit [Caulobacteraceae bacterium]|jgi:succinate dehydrogenase / fumarate reductase cytochrome b subunit
MVETLGKARPLSPNWQNWRWHVTMTASILHRVAGMLLYLGLLVLAGWALALAQGSEPFAAYARLLISAPGVGLLFLITLSGFFHLANGIRHLAWDLGFGFKLKTADATAWVALGFGLLATAAFWWRLSSLGVFHHG